MVTKAIMSGRLSKRRIDAAYRDSWLLLGSPKYTPSGKLVSGEVLWVGPTYQALLDRLGTLKTPHRHTAEYFAGDLVFDEVFVF